MNNQTQPTTPAPSQKAMDCALVLCRTFDLLANNALLQARVNELEAEVGERDTVIYSLRAVLAEAKLDELMGQIDELKIDIAEHKMYADACAGLLNEDGLRAAKDNFERAKRRVRKEEVNK